MLKDFFNFILYSLTALTACFFSLILVLNFLNPAFSSPSFQAQEELTFKKVFSDIWSNLKLILRDLKQDKNGSAPPPVPPPQEDTPDPVEDPAVSPPESFGGDEDLTAPNDEPPSPQDGIGEPPQPAGPAELSLPGDMPLQNENPAGALSGDLPPQGGGSAGAPSGDLPPQGEGFAGAPSGEILPQDLGQKSLEEQLPSEISLQIQSDMAPFVYETPDLRNPFDDPTRKDTPGEVVETKGEVKVVIPKTPPEMYDLSEIKLKGIIWNTQNPKALFELPGDSGHYTLIKGDKIGKNGLIFEIREDEVVIVETYYRTAESNASQTTEQFIKIKKMDRLKLDQGRQN